MRSPQPACEELHKRMVSVTADVPLHHTERCRVIRTPAGNSAQVWPLDHFCLFSQCGEKWTEGSPSLPLRLGLVLGKSLNLLNAKFPHQ